MPNDEFGIHNLTKHCNESLILASLFGKKKHGYQIALEIEEKSEGLFKFNHGTLYPILHKLEKNGLIKGAWKQEGPKRKRKYYALTAKGRKYVKWQLSQWQAFKNYLFEIVGVVE